MSMPALVRGVARHDARRLHLPCTLHQNPTLTLQFAFASAQVRSAARHDARGVHPLLDLHPGERQLAGQPARCAKLEA